MPKDIIYLHPVGIVKSDIENPQDMPFGGTLARIEIYPEYQPALKGIEENSHIWLLLWFHLSDRQLLVTRPARINPDLPEFGVFALRAFNRPNPIALTRVKLEKVEKNSLWVSGLDAVNGTPVIDIKPYYEADIVLSPRTPYIKPKERQLLMENFLVHALTHHQEECTDLFLAVRMAVIAGEILGQITRNEVEVKVLGSRCLADTIQGLTHARLGNPPRLTFCETASIYPVTIWTRGDQGLILIGKRNIMADEFWNLDDKDLIQIIHS